MLPYEEELDIKDLSKLFNNMSESYKLFWFQAIVNCIISKKYTLTYNELINEMIADAWYMVSEYKLNLGPSDTLEWLIHHLHKISGLKSNEKKEDIIEYLNNCKDKELNSKKLTLTYHVPYRLQAPFFRNIDSRVWKKSKQDLINKINQERRLVYYFTSLSGLKTQIHIQPEWQTYIRCNQEIIRGWIKHNMVAYLQRRNPGIPGIIDKLNPPQERNLTKVRDYWKAISDLIPIRDIYSDVVIESKDLSIDHFIPWSYVAHDELWNLCATSKNLNSSKGNKLPDWELYFPRLSRFEYQVFRKKIENTKIHKIQKEFVRCKKQHINSSEVLSNLYLEDITEDVFLKRLENILYPLYQSAQNVGFKSWKVGS